MSAPGLTRRRTITIIAATCASVLAAPSVLPRHEWHGTALGAEGRLIFHGLDGNRADELIAMVIAEVDRLEQVFSLYRPDSEIGRLNRTTRLEHPSHDFKVVLAAALDVWRRSGRAFNPAIQPLWAMLAGHFAGGPDRADPDPRQILATLDLCNPAQIALERDAITLKPGMALTFNGIAQGYITDRVASLLRQHCLNDTLVQLGETRVLPGRAWPVEVAGTGRLIDLRNGAIATSAGGGTKFSDDGRWHHLIDPKTGRSDHDFNSITVRASSAMTADALSTALAVAGSSNAAGIARRFPHTRVLTETPSGEVVELNT